MKPIRIFFLIVAFLLFTMGGKNTLGALAETYEGTTEQTVFSDSSATLQDGGFCGVQLMGYSGFSMLFSQQSTMVSLCSRIADTMENFGTSVDIDGLDLPYNESTVTDIMTCLSAVLNSYPQYFSYRSGFSYSYTSTTIVSITLKFRVDEVTARTERAAFYVSVNQALNDVLPATEYDENPSNDVMSATEKALALHDYLALHGRYHHDALKVADANQRLVLYPNIYNAYGALVDKNAVCQGIALAYTALLKAVGLNSYIVTSNNLSHAWNIVSVEDGNWYYVDVTWDDPSIGIEYNDDRDWMGFCSHDCFMMTETELEQNRFTSYENDVNIRLIDGAVPQTPEVSHPNSLFWKDVQSGMFYCAGNWYFNSGELSSVTSEPFLTRGEIKRAPYETSGNTGTTIANNACFPAFDGDYLYYYDYEANSINCFNPRNENESVLLALNENEVISEFAAGELNLRGFANGSDYLVPEGKLAYILHDDGVIVCLLDIPMMAGDVNGDGYLNVSDVVLLCRSIVGSVQLSGISLDAADLDVDGAVTLADGLKLCRLLVG